jgi:hypothetical protein
METGSVPPLRPSSFLRIYEWLAHRIDLSSGWDRLPRYTGALVLGGLRTQLRRTNLYDTSKAPSNQPPPPGAKGDRHLTARTVDGSFNDLQVPDMGRAGTRFGRNVPLQKTFPQNERLLLRPSPRVVSRELLTRERFIAATSLNLLAGAWLQFMVHDWLSHGKNEKHNPWRIELEPDDEWPQRPMQILRTRRDPTRPDRADGQPPTFINTASPWWDASQLYGNDEKTEAAVRAGEGGKLRIEPNRLLPVDPKTGVEITGVSGNWWLGLDLMHTLFALEHNAICDRLHAEYPSWADQELFDRARLINAALLAKIHTVEWTPAILAHPTIRVALRANWWGLAEERVHRLLGRISGAEWISGIPGSETNHFGVPYSITEEFVAVYRMHPLLPDDYPLRAVKDDHVIEERQFPQLVFGNARKVLETVGMENALYSFGVMNPGALTLHNFPRALQRLTEPDGTTVDLAATDILRVRERGVPRYNEFRRLLHKPPLKRFDQLSDNPEWVEQLKNVYNNDISSVDLMVGLYAEPRPAGFGFSDTAFRIFILMASRRLNSDRFFTTAFTPEVYTPAGMKWLDDNGFASVLLRHFPGLRPALHKVENPFAPWAQVRR